MLAGRPGVELLHHVVEDQAGAERWGMHGSPTLLIDGHDPFAGQGTPASVSCRLYRGLDGRAGGAPSVDDLRRVLAAPGTTADPDRRSGPAGPATRSGRPDPDAPSGLGLLVAVVAVALVCCARPALIVAAASGALAAWLGNPWVIAVAALPAVGAGWWWLRRQRVCCPPRSNPSHDNARDREPHGN